MIARLRWWTRRRIAVLGTALTAGAGAVISYDALAAVARTSGQPEGLSWIYPLAVDGMIAVATMATLEVRQARLRTRFGVWLLLAAAIGVSVLGNAVHAGELGLRTLWSAVPACAYAAALHLLVVIYRHGAPQARPQRASRQARPRRRALKVVLEDGREVSAAHARKLRARQRVIEAQAT